MEQIILYEENKKRIQRYIKQQVGFYGYEQDIRQVSYSSAFVVYEK